MSPTSMLQQPDPAPLGAASMSAISTRPRAGRWLTAWLALLTLSGVGLAQTARPDQIWVRKKNSPTVSTFSGRITENSLSKVVLEGGEKPREFDPLLVDRLQFGDVPASYLDGQLYFDRSEFEKAAASFKQAAGEAGARVVVQASARLRVGEALMQLGRIDARYFSDASQEFGRFLGDYADNREVPRARQLAARALLLSGDAAGASRAFAALFQEAAAGKAPAGYSLLACLGAGLSAGNAALDAKDSAGAKLNFESAASAITSAAAAAAEDPALAQEFKRLAAEARVGEGLVLLSSGAAPQAATFFQGLLAKNAADQPSGQRFGALLGLALALQAQGQHRQAQIEYARLSALDPEDRDRTARALIGLAETTLQLGDKDARVSAQTWLKSVVDQYGDTPSVRKAQDMLRTL